MNAPELVQLAWDAFVDAGAGRAARKDPRLLAIIRRFGHTERWAIINGINELIRLNELARFRFTCLDVHVHTKPMYWTTGDEALHNAEFKHWRGMRGRRSIRHPPPPHVDVFDWDRQYTDPEIRRFQRELIYGVGHEG